MPQFQELPQQLEELECSKILLISPLSYNDHIPSDERNNLMNSYIKVISSIFGSTPVMDASSFEVPQQDDWIPEFQIMKQTTQQWPNLDTIHSHIDTLYYRFQRFIELIRNNPNMNEYVAAYKLHLLDIVHDPT